MHRRVEIEFEGLNPGDVIAFDQIEAFSDDQSLFVLGVVQIDIGNAQLENQIGRDVWLGGELDNPVPRDRADALSRHAYPKAHRAEGFKLDRRTLGTQAGILSIKILALIRPGPKRCASSGREHLSLQSLVENQVTDAKRQPDLRSIGRARAQDHDRNDGWYEPRPPRIHPRARFASN